MENHTTGVFNKFTSCKLLSTVTLVINDNVTDTKKYIYLYSIEYIEAIANLQ